MAVSVVTTGNGKRVGGPSEVTAYSAHEEATPLTPGNSRGSVGTVSFSGVAKDEEQTTLLLLNDTITLSDGSNGLVSGFVNDVSISDGRFTAAGDSRTGLLVAERDVQPFSGVLADAIEYYLSLVGIVSGIYIDPAIASRTVAYPGWSGDVWLALKEICAAEQIEIQQVSGNIVARPLRTRTLEVLKESQRRTAANNIELSRNVEVEYYEGAYTPFNTHIYPIDPTDPPQPQQVESGEKVVFDTVVHMSVSNIMQPTAVDIMDFPYVDGTSAYTVLTREANPYPAAQWVANGGKVTVEVLPDTYTLRVTIIAPIDPTNGPFRLGQRISPGDENDTSTRSTLHIAGSGVTAVPKRLTIPTGAPDEKTGRETLATVKGRFIWTTAGAYDAAALVAAQAARPRQIISAQATVVNRKGDKGSVNYPTFGDFDLLYPNPDTFGTFDADYPNPKTFADFDADMFALVADNFENQAFGNVAGARVRREDSIYRVVGADITESSISYEAEQDTIFSDFDTEWAGKTFAQFDADWTGYTFDDHAIAPLRKVS